MHTCHTVGSIEYPHMEELLALDWCRVKGRLSRSLLTATTLLNVRMWEVPMRQHPDQRYGGYITQGIKEGFRIGADRSKLICPAAYNLPLALQHPWVVTEYLDAVKEHGQILCPVHFEAMGNPKIQINRVGVIPKGQSGKWQLITDLSYPRGHSVNAAINPDLCSLTYTTVEKVAQPAMSLSRGVLMAEVEQRVNLPLGSSLCPRSAPSWAILGGFNLRRQNVALWTVVCLQDI